MALRQAGLRVFSLSYWDVEEPGTPRGTEVLLPGHPNQVGLLKQYMTRFAELQGVNQPGVPVATNRAWEQLLAYLAEPDGTRWALQALAMCAIAFDRNSAPEAPWNAVLKEYVASEYAVDWADDKVFRVQRQLGGAWQLLLQLAQAAIKHGDVRQVQGLLVSQSAGGLSTDALTEADWNTALYVANTLQFLPGFAYLAPGQHWTGGGNPQPRLGLEGPGPTEESVVLDPVWEALSEFADARLRPLFARWMAAGVVPPEEAQGVCGAAGRVVAEAECLWSASRVAVLTEDQWQWAAALQAEGWLVWSIADLVSGVIDDAEVIKHVHAHS